jgi:hypothetical protein
VLFTRTPFQKCDGVRPTCGPCARLQRNDQCQYTDSPSLTLQARELMRPSEQGTGDDSVTLFNPYTSVSPSSDDQLQSVSSGSGSNWVTRPPDTGESQSSAEQVIYTLQLELSVQPPAHQLTGLSVRSNRGSPQLIRSIRRS